MVVELQLRNTVNWARERAPVIAPVPCDLTVMEQRTGLSRWISITAGGRIAAQQ